MNPILIDMPLPISTPRLYIREVRPGDGEAINEAKKESLKDLEPWMAWAQHGEKGLCLEEDEAFCREKYAAFIRRDDMMMVAFDQTTDKLIACTGLHDPKWDIPSFTIGYWVRSSQTGQGFATELTIALCQYAFQALEARRVDISHAGGNEGSRRVIEKVGFTLEGIAKASHKVGDRLYDSHDYAMIDEEQLPELTVSW